MRARCTSTVRADAKIVGYLLGHTPADERVENLAFAWAQFGHAFRSLHFFGLWAPSKRH
jgi:hypothetical protein